MKLMASQAVTQPSVRLLARVYAAPTGPWSMAAYGLYLFAFACWAPVVWLQIKARRLAQRAADGEEPLG